MMYQLPIDMMTRMAMVPLETRSPPCHTACRPYGFSTSSVVRVAPAGAGVAGGVDSDVVAGAAGAAGCACANTAEGTSTAGMAVSRIIAHAAKRVIFIM